MAMTARPNGDLTTGTSATGLPVQIASEVIATLSAVI
jgi:hypothetical protein